MTIRFTPQLRIAAASLVAVAGVLALVAAYAPRPATHTARGAPGSSASQSLPTGGLTFASTPTSAAIVSSSVVTAAGKGISGGSVAINESATLTKWPKGHGPASIHGSGGVNGGSSASGPGQSTPGTSSSFIGQQGSATTCSYFAHGCNPPDMALAASPNFVLQGVNTSWEVLDTSGKVLSGPFSAQNFFGAPSEPDNCDPGSGNQPFLSDPRALYDPADGRFWAAMLQIEGSAAFGVAPNCPYKSVYWVAVSQTSDPTGAWNVYQFNMETDVAGQKFGADYTQLGINSEAVYFSGNMFGENGGFFAEIFEANKSQMESGGTSFT
ncbi:MAG TPA: hypothetical protein VGA61_19990, partial [Anaerolineae bacterium]